MNSVLAALVAEYDEIPRDKFWDRREGELTATEIRLQTGKNKHVVYAALNAGLKQGRVLKRRAADGRVYWCPLEQNTPKRVSRRQSRSSQ